MYSDIYYCLLLDNKYWRFLGHDRYRLLFGMVDVLKHENYNSLEYKYEYKKKFIFCVSQ